MILFSPSIEFEIKILRNWPGNIHHSVEYALKAFLDIIYGKTELVIFTIVENMHSILGYNLPKNWVSNIHHSGGSNNVHHSGGYANNVHHSGGYAFKPFSDIIYQKTKLVIFTILEDMLLNHFRI